MTEAPKPRPINKNQDGRRARKSTKPPARDDCVVPPRIPPDALKHLVLSGEAEHERQAIRDYVTAESHEDVLHVERVNTERIFGRDYEVWDVHTNESRWWVITSPTNLHDFRQVRRRVLYPLSYGRKSPCRRSWTTPMFDPP
jgi:hypothetical protein